MHDQDGHVLDVGDSAPVVRKWCGLVAVPGGARVKWLGGFLSDESGPEWPEWVTLFLIVGIATYFFARAFATAIIAALLRLLAMLQGIN